MLTPLLRRVPSDEEVAAATNQLGMLRVWPLDEAVTLVVRYLQARPEGKGPLGEQQDLVDELFTAAVEDTPLSLRVRHDFGVISRYHERALKDAIGRGTLTRPDALRLIDNGVALTRHLANASSATVPLSFRTADFDGLPQAADDRMHGWASLPAPATGSTGSDVIVEEVLEIPTPGKAFSFIVTNEWELGQAALPEDDTTQWLDSTIDHDSVLWDVGANVGYLSLYAASLQTTVRVVSFEPAPMNIGRLNANIRANHLGNRVVAFPVAVSDVTGLSTFGNSYLTTGGWCQRGLVSAEEVDGWIGEASSKGGMSDADAAEARKRNRAVFPSGCPVYSLDDFAISAPWLPRPTHIKVDVDGLEVNVVKGAQRLLREERLEYVLIEARDDRTASAVEQALTAAGFRLSSRPPPSAFGNWIFERRRRNRSGDGARD